jgi:hypothetical protein
MTSGLHHMNANRRWRPAAPLVMLNAPRAVYHRALGARRRMLLTLAAGTIWFGLMPATAHTLDEIGEWVVACDNAATCSLVNAARQTQLRLAQPSPFGMSRICIHRRAGPDAAAQVFITLRTLAPKDLSAHREPKRIRVVGSRSAPADIAMDHRGAEHWQVPAEAAPALLAAVEDGGQLHVLAPDGTVIERLSVEGIDRALATTDKVQGRSSTVTALREAGDAPASRVPAPVPPPALVTAPLARLMPAPAPSPAAVRLRQEACGAPGFDQTTGFRLLGDQRRADRILWASPCESRQGLRQALFVIENADGTAEPVAFPGSDPERPTGRQGLVAITNVDDARGLVQELWREPVASAAGKSCFIQRLWGWNGRAFELAEERRSLTCAGIVSGHWPTTHSRTLITPASSGQAVSASSFRPPC